MKQKMKHIGFGLALALAGVVNAMGAGGANFLWNACEHADAVVLGTAKLVPPEKPRARLELTVDSVIRGEIQPGNTVLVEWPGSPFGARVGAPGRALWFLTRSDSGNWSIVPVSGSGAPMFASALAVPEHLANTEHLSSGTTCLEAVWTVLKQDAPYVDESQYYRIGIETLLHGDPRVTISAFPGAADTIGAFSEAPSVNLRTLALAFRIRQGDVRALELASATAEELSKSKVAHVLMGALSGWRQDPSPRAVAALGTFTEASMPSAFAGSAGEALMHIHSKEAAPFLANLLQSEDSKLQALAIRGLSLFAKGVPVLTASNLQAMAYLADSKPNEFVDDAIKPYVVITPIPSDRESEYRDAWLAWWGRNAAKWEADPPSH